MEASSQRGDGGGLWTNPRPSQYTQYRPSQYSKDTQDMLRLMMQQSRFTNLQRKKINECLKNGAALPLTSEPTSLASSTKLKTTKSVQKRLPCIPQRRSAEACRSGNSYVREKFHPGPSRDLEKEKRRLQNILATGEEEPRSVQNVPACRNPEVVEQKDRYQEVLDEIEERRQFLADMSSLGQEKQYINIINSEISQRIRELQVLDKARSPENDAITSERNGERAEQKTWR
ncbi:UPF0193 protein EVG1 [Anoplopoma fimbria]|uniref:UPF0193 protein EVG1 n=1 Tax=Anoplopoma fimbria TaxID=229290 RepID=UPI0023ED62AC|nr:UPF0193 protein EVG1 [Anoplopoma fimbria]